jgi:hypothetical protein
MGRKASTMTRRRLSAKISNERIKWFVIVMVRLPIDCLNFECLSATSPIQLPLDVVTLIDEEKKALFVQAKFDRKRRIQKLDGWVSFRLSNGDENGKGAKVP